MDHPNIPTAITEAEASKLRELAWNKSRVLEVGPLLGFSTITLAYAACEVVSVDPHYGYPEESPTPTLQPFLQNLEDYGVRHKVRVMVGTDREILPLLKDHHFSMAFIDATGKFEDTWRILHAVCPLMRRGRGSVIAVHDCGHPEWPGAESAVKLFAEQYHKDYLVVERLAYFYSGRNGFGH